MAESTSSAPPLSPKFDAQESAAPLSPLPAQENTTPPHFSSPSAQPLAIHKSDLDDRQYRAVTLPNRMKMLLVSDTLSRKAAVAMNVSVGYSSDPEDFPGLAHLLEHVIFLGSQRYPDENAFDKFLAENGGKSNGLTNFENTVINFEMYPSISDKFVEGLKRFSHVLRSPLLKKCAVERQIISVDEEYQLRRDDDEWRRKHVFRANSNPQHPFSNFGDGSSQTLGMNSQATRDALEKFHAEYYTANLMNLCVIAPYPLSRLEEWVTEHFSSFALRDTPSPWLRYINLKPFLEAQQGTEINIASAYENNFNASEVQIAWVTPISLLGYSSKPDDLVNTLLEDKRQGGMFHLLQERKVSKLKAIHQKRMNFGIQFLTLTLEDGWEDYFDDVIAIVYEFIRLIKGKVRKSDEFVYLLYEQDKIKKESEFKFRFREDPGIAAPFWSMNMQYCATKDYIRGASCHEDFEPAKVLEILECLTPERGIMMITSSQLTSMDRSEPDSGTPYRINAVDEDRMAIWNLDRFQAYLKVLKPVRSERRKEVIVAEDTPPSPDDLIYGPQQILKDNKAMDLYFKLDRKFKRPKACIYIKIELPVEQGSLKDATLLAILKNMWYPQLHKQSTEAAKAGVSYKLSVVPSGLELRVHGFSDRISEVFQMFDFGIMKLLAHFTPARFEQARTYLENGYKIESMAASSYILAEDRVKGLLTDHCWDVENRLEIAKEGKVTHGDMEAFMEKSTNAGGMFLSSLMCGNISQEASENLAKLIISDLCFNPEVKPDKPRQMIFLYPGQDVFTRRIHTNKNMMNSAIAVYYGTDPEENAQNEAELDVLCSIMQGPMESELRTMQQLGYYVQFNRTSFSDIPGLCFGIQSSNHAPDDLLQRIENFLANFRATVLLRLHPYKIKQHANICITRLEEPDRTLEQYAENVWEEIDSGRLNFDRDLDKIRALKLVTKNSLLQFFLETFENDQKRRRIISQVFGNNHPMPDLKTSPPYIVQVDDTACFHRARQAPFPTSSSEKLKKALKRVHERNVGLPLSDMERDSKRPRI